MSADEKAARLLAPGATDPEPALTVEEEAASLEAVALALAARRSGARRRWSTVALAAAAALVALVGVGAAARWRHADERLLVVLDGDGSRDEGASSVALERGARLREGTVLRASPGAVVSARFREGTTLTLGRSGVVEVLRADEERRLGLRAGVLEARVKALGAGERFVVETRRAVLEVRGTQFSVDVTPASSTCRDGAVRVRVDEGQVSVDVGSPAPLRTLRAGDEWEAPCVLPPVEPAVNAAQPVPSPPAPHRAEPESSLKRMNALYERALQLKREGKLEEAAAALASLRRAFPMGPLDEAAAVEELRLLERLSPERAQRAARQYLEDYPSGYARDIAQRLRSP
ncbi:MAG: FecR domain-containing protein [Myxococcaceae bacterium]|nr:FecR domain-containing protein [Myxococcaceae bacterium]